MSAFKSNAVCVAVLIGLFASLVLSTLPSPTSDFCAVSFTHSPPSYLKNSPCAGWEIITSERSLSCSAPAASVAGSHTAVAASYAITWPSVTPVVFTS